MPMDSCLDADTICAIATPPGRGGVGIVRISGALVGSVSQAILRQLPTPRHATYLPFHSADGAVIDHGIALFFPAPHSYTGQDVLELQAHGGPLVLAMLQRACVQGGAREARPGEFTERAFLNGKLDLVQAEAVADLIHATSEHAVRAAARSLEGEFSARIHAFVEQLIELRLFVEASIDFADEDIELLEHGHVQQRLAQLRHEIAHVQQSARQGQLLRDGMTIVIAGRPNAGKSSLLNRLAGQDIAIVTDIPGTTRDVLRSDIHLEGLPLHIIDTAGLRDSVDPVEQIGIARAREQVRRADRVLLIVDDRDTAAQMDELLAQLPTEIPCTVIRNKIDLTGRAPGFFPGAPPTLALSVTTGAGYAELTRHLQETAGYQGGGTFSARERHVSALERAQRHLEHAAQHYAEHVAIELLAEDLNLAQQALAEITGAFVADDLLGRIFSTFCLGK